MSNTPPFDHAWVDGHNVLPSANRLQHRASGEHVRVSRQHDRSHCATGGKPGDEDSLTIDCMIDRHLLNHLPDRQRLSPITMTIVRLEPVKGSNSVVGASLLREQKGKTVLIGESRQSASMIIVLRSLQAGMQDNNKRAARWETVWNVCGGLQRSRVGSNACQGEEFFRNVHDGQGSRLWGWTI